MPPKGSPIAGGKAEASRGYICPAPCKGAREEFWGSEEKLIEAWMLAEATPAAPAGGGKGSPRKLSLTGRHRLEGMPGT